MNTDSFFDELNKIANVPPIPSPRTDSDATASTAGNVYRSNPYVNLAKNVVNYHNPFGGIGPAGRQRNIFKDIGSAVTGGAMTSRAQN